ncbi:MAG: hypothetical protein V4584_16865 [Verrucomicrobiota bacterium]
MKKSSTLLLAGVCSAGLLTGLSARRLVVGNPAPVPVLSGSSPPVSGRSPATTAPARPALQDIPPQRSADSLESLTAIEGGAPYQRLALWLMDASPRDIAAYWEIYRKGQRTDDLTDLIFLHWTRLDPLSAIAAVAGGDDEKYPWWAWSCHDPRAALAAATAAGSECVGHVAWGIGEFHPQWLRLHARELPDFARIIAMDGMVKWHDGENPADSLRFLQENSRSPQPGTLKALARQDPWAAFEWAKQNTVINDPFSDVPQSMQLVLQTLSEERPEDLQRLAAQTPSGELKLQMESALFAHLLKTDPAAALEQARSTIVPRIAAERYAAIGLDTVRTDPALALDLAKNLLTACPDALDHLSTIVFPGGISSHEVTIPGVSEFLTTLLERQPAELLEAAHRLPTTSQETGAFSLLSTRWASSDLPGYTAWVDKQTDPTVRETGGALISHSLSASGNFPEAADWAIITPALQDKLLPDILSKWQASDPEAPRRWLDSSRLPPHRKALVQYYLDLPR